MICLLGIAGSGKSTQADLLVKALNCPLIYTGAILRQYATGEARKQLEAGAIVTDEVTIPLLESELKRQHADTKECILDGSPRSMDQAEWIVRMEQQKQVKSAIVVHLVLDRQTALERLKNRKRSDDLNMAVIEQRFKEYEDRMDPILKYVSDNGVKVINVDAGRSIEEIHQAIMESLNAS